MKARTIILQIQACIISPTAIVKMYSISCVILKSEATSENIRGLEYNQNSLILKKKYGKDQRQVHDNNNKNLQKFHDNRTILLSIQIQTKVIN